MRNTSGFIKLWRSIDSNAWLSRDGVAYCVFTKLLLWANDEPGTSFLKRQLVRLRRGQLATSPSELAGATGFNEKTIARRLEMLAAEKMIVQQVSNDGRIITIVNYNHYQARPGELVQQESSRAESRAGRRTDSRAGRRAETYGRMQECKNVRSNPLTPSTRGRAQKVVDELVAVFDAKSKDEIVRLKAELGDDAVTYLAQSRHRSFEALWVARREECQGFDGVSPELVQEFDDALAQDVKRFFRHSVPTRTNGGGIVLPEDHP